MKESLETFFNHSELIFTAYRLRGKEAFKKQLILSLNTIARKNKGQKEDLDRQFSSLASAILGHFLENDAKKVLREKLNICEKSWSEKSAAGKINSLAEEFSLFCSRFEGGDGRLSYQVLKRIESTDLEGFREMTVESLADSFGYSVSHFSKKFKKEQGISLSHAIHSAKLNYAFLLVKSSRAELSLDEVANSLGFTDVGYFRSCFKKKFGMAPFDLELG